MFLPGPDVKHAIFSHTWGNEEVGFQEVGARVDAEIPKKGWSKLSIPAASPARLTISNMPSLIPAASIRRAAPSLAMRLTACPIGTRCLTSALFSSKLSLAVGEMPQCTTSILGRCAMVQTCNLSARNLAGCSRVHVYAHLPINPTKLPDQGQHRLQTQR